MKKNITITNIRFFEGQESVFIGANVPDIPGHYLVRAGNAVILASTPPQIVLYYREDSDNTSSDKDKDLYPILRKNAITANHKLAGKIRDKFSGHQFASIEEFVKELIKFLNE